MSLCIFFLRNIWSENALQFWCLSWFAIDLVYVYWLYFCLLWYRGASPLPPDSTNRGACPIPLDAPVMMCIVLCIQEVVLFYVVTYYMKLVTTSWTYSNRLKSLREQQHKNIRQYKTRRSFQSPVVYNSSP